MMSLCTNRYEMQLEEYNNDINKYTFILKPQNLKDISNIV